MALKFRWLLLIILSLLLAATLQAAGLPAALLLGPMLAAIVIETTGGGLRLPPPLHHLSQAVVGCLVARAMTPAIIATFAERWPLFTATVLSVIFASCTLGWSISRLKILPGTTAVWGLLPGAASAMVLLAEAFDADARLVAFMQYLRVLCVAFAASLVARFWVAVPATGTALAPLPHTSFFPAIHFLAFSETLLLIAGAMLLGPRLKIPAAILLLPMVLGSCLSLAGVVTIELPPWLLATSYAFLGWSVGLRFTRAVLAHALRALPQTLLAIGLLMTFCVGLAYILVKTLQIDPLTAYLATSPGGMDSVAIIAASSKVDVPFVMALQTVRFLLVLGLGPIASRLVASRLQAPLKHGQENRPKNKQELAIDKQLLEQAREDESDLD